MGSEATSRSLLVLCFALQGDSQVQAKSYLPSLALLASTRLRIVDLYGGTRDATIFVAFSIAYTAVLLITVGMIAQLFFFHVNLQRRGISTYDFVVEDAKIRQKKEREKYEKKKEDKRRMEAGGTKVCGLFWIGGEGGENGVTNGASNGTGKHGDEEDGEGGAANIDENSIELTEMIVRDDDMKEAEL